MAWVIRVCGSLAVCWGLMSVGERPAYAAPADPLAFNPAAIFLSTAGDGPAPSIAAQVLLEELQSRTKTGCVLVTEWPEEGPRVVVMTRAQLEATEIDAGRTLHLPDKPEGYGITTIASDDSVDEVWIIGEDLRGALYGVGRLLRTLDLDNGIRMTGLLNETSAPAFPIRGHQLGYRNTANSYDAWDAAQYERYIRELALFGVNSIENIPFQGDAGPHLKLSREEMSAALSAICAKYDLDYWVWTPADFDLEDEALWAEALEKHEAFYKSCPRLDGVFFPGGDPGDNHPKLVMPFLADVAARLAKHHPGARIWISLQGFEGDRVEYFYRWLDEHSPDWLAGVVAGPSSPFIEPTRLRLDSKYRLRHYPDLTHTVRCQYPAPWWDPAYAFTLGRESVNPEPVRHAYVHNRYAHYTDGFISYSDGVHDDVNKILWSAKGWNPQADVRDSLLEYARLFFGNKHAEVAADGILALERNWRGPLAENGGVDGTFALWQGLERDAPELRDNWRFQLLLLRAFYDCYTRHRLLHERELEADANAVMLSAAEIGAGPAMDKALAILARAETDQVKPELRAAIVDLCERAFRSIGLQTSVEKYQASGHERGAVLDYVDYPLNNRWWLEDEIVKIRASGDEAEKVAALTRIASWEQPEPDSRYDDIGNVAKSAHVLRDAYEGNDPLPERIPMPDCMWWDNGMHRYRQSWVSFMNWPRGLRYGGLDPGAKYVVRTTGYGKCLLRVDGARVEPRIDGTEIGAIKEFDVPAEAYADREIVLTFDIPLEPGINWRQQSRLNEVWLLER